MNTHGNDDTPLSVQQDVQQTAVEPTPDGQTTHPRGRDGKGRFVPGHFHSTTHALHTDRVPPEFAHLQAEVDAFLAGSLADEGEPDVPTRRRSQVGYRAIVHRKILQLADALDRRGIFDHRGRLRVQWLTQLNALLSQARQQDQLLGLERRQRQIPNLATYLQQRQDGESNGS